MKGITRVRDIVIDEQGGISFAVPSYGGFLGIRSNPVVVPFKALSHDGKGHSALNMSKERFTVGLHFNNEWRSARSWTDNLHRYSGGSLMVQHANDLPKQILPGRAKLPARKRRGSQSPGPHP